jgi:hypothetical protein
MAATTTVLVSNLGGEPFEMDLTRAQLNVCLTHDAWRVLAIDGVAYSDSRDVEIVRHADGLVWFNA